MMKMMSKRNRMRITLGTMTVLMFSACLAVFSSASQADSIAIQNNQKLAFMGDSITANGWGHSAGYVRLVVSGLQTSGVTVTPVPAGISGNTSKDMLARLDRDVLSKKPDWMTLSCGVNDVWHGANGVPLDQYKINITSIIDQAQTAGIKVMILTSTPIGEDIPNANNQKLIDYNAFLHQLASDKHCLIADLNAAVQDALKSKKGTGNYLTVDGVHMNPRGDQVMASTILTAFGLTAQQLAKAKAVWQDIPGGWTVDVAYSDPSGKKNERNQPLNVLRARVPLTIRSYEALNEVATPPGTTEASAINMLFASDVKAMLKPAGTYDSIDAIFDASQQSAVQQQLNDQINVQITGKKPMVASVDSGVTLPANAGPNLALNKKHENSDPNVSGWDKGLNDGSWETTRDHTYASGRIDVFPKTATIDLETPANVGLVLVGVPPFGSTKTVKVSVSTDDKDFKEVGSYGFSLNKEEKHLFTFTPVSARYVRLTYADRYDDTVQYPPAHAFTTEVEVYAPGKAK